MTRFNLAKFLKAKSRASLKVRPGSRVPSKKRIKLEKIQRREARHEAR